MKVIENIKERAGGFITREIREGGVRKGFKIVTLDGDEALLAHVDISSPLRVGKYGVDKKAMEEKAVPSILKAMEEKDIIVIDEIGKMELFSESFKEALKKVLFSQKPVLGTITQKSLPFSDYVKSLPFVRVIRVGEGTLEEVRKWVEGWL